jgi:hypothetical protein
MKISNIAFLILTVGLFSFQSCGSSKKLERPMEKYKELLENRISYLNIPISIDVTSLEKSIDQDMDGVIYEDKDINDDGTMLKLEKQGSIDIQADTSQLTYQLPLKVWVKYDAGITYVEGEGIIKLDFLTKYSINPDWELQTLTSIEQYEWIEKPKLRLAGLNFSVGFLGDLIVRNSRVAITRTIDTMVKENLNLSERIKETWTQLQEPILVAEEYNTWLTVNPTDIGMTPIQTQDRTIKSTIMIESKPAISVGPRPATAMSNYFLPPFKYADGQVNEEFALLVSAEITYAEAERLAREEAAGETYDYGKRSFTVDDINLYGQEDKLVVDVLLSGSYNGNVYLTGEPVYNDRNNSIKIKNLKYTLKTRNLLFKTAGWLLKSTFKNKIEETLNFYLDYNLEAAKQQLKQQLANFNVTNGVMLNGDLEELAIKDANLTPQGMKVDVILRGKLNLLINGLN